jgi:hypothetical protein
MVNPPSHPNAAALGHLQGAVERFGFFMRPNRIHGGACPDGGTAIDGINMRGS